VIPAEAVEAATKALIKAWGYETEWDEGTAADARIALEAAAPHMGARSDWHDAVAGAYVEGALSAEQANVMWAKNPYKQ
jgi:hypothetical protein